MLIPQHFSLLPISRVRSYRDYQVIPPDLSQSPASLIISCESNAHPAHVRLYLLLLSSTPQKYRPSRVQARPVFSPGGVYPSTFLGHGSVRSHQYQDLGKYLRCSATIVHKNDSNINEVIRDPDARCSYIRILVSTGTLLWLCNARILAMVLCCMYLVLRHRTSGDIRRLERSYGAISRHVQLHRDKRTCSRLRAQKACF